MNWIPFELHTHTCHTDGEFEPGALPALAHACGLRGIALTDHNTTACYEAFDDGLRQMPGMIGLHGMEWTTYYGHMLVLGEQGYTDWRGISPHEIDGAVDRIHAHGGLVGIAHPYALSNPVNTGYRWGFQMQDWNKIDFIEVWSRDFPANRIRSKNAFALWDAMLREGYRIAATSGRDWHRPDTKPTHYGVTYLGLSDDAMNAAGALDAVRCGRICVTAGPLLTAQLSHSDQMIHPGDVSPCGTVRLMISLDSKNNVSEWRRFPIQPVRWKVILNGVCIAERACAEQTEDCIEVELTPGWLRVELFGTYPNAADERIAFTNPFYIR